MGDFPLMTEQGTFIINGAERVIVSQLVRSPGMYYEFTRDKTGKPLYATTIIPYRGAWLEYETDSNDVFSVRIDRTRKIPVTVLIRAMGIQSNSEILEKFGDDARLKATFEKDLTDNRDDALLEIYKKLRPGEPLNVENAESLITNMFFDPKRYDLAHVGRYKYDKKMVSLNGDVVTAKKVGKTTIHVYSKIDNISKDIDITIKKKAKEVVKEEKKDEPVVETGLVVKDGITYVDGIMIVNKTYSLPSSYNPGGLTDEFMDAFYEMQSAASLDGISLFVASGFRSYEYQEDLYNAYVKRDGKEAADTYSARPGYSEHQTGLAADINAADSSFDDTEEAKWLAENCYKYGFIIRFPKGKEQYTGYIYESWHLRYVGKDLAKKIHEAGDISLEEYYNLTSVYRN